jgi:hypothetical protein
MFSFGGLLARKPNARRGKSESAILRSTLTHWETLESRHCRAAVDDVIAKTAADFSPDSDPEQLLVTSLSILGNDKSLSGNLADLSIVSTTACVNTKNGGFLKFTRDGAGGITGVKYGLPTRAIISEEKFDKAKDFVLSEISVWHAEELVRIENYYRTVGEVIDRFVGFYRANVGAGAGWFASAGGSSLKDIGSAAISLKPAPGAVLSVGGRAMELLLSAYRSSQLETLDGLVSATREQLRQDCEAEFKTASAEALSMSTDFLNSFSKEGKRVFGNDSFVYTEVDKAPMISPANRPMGIMTGAMGTSQAAGMSLISSATVRINLNIEDYSGPLAQVTAWREGHDLKKHKYDAASQGRLEDMYGDALIAFASRGGFDVEWKNGKWVGRDFYSPTMSVPRSSAEEQAAHYAAVMSSRWLTFDGIDIAAELNRIGYKKK